MYNMVPYVSSSIEARRRSHRLGPLHYRSRESTDHDVRILRIGTDL